MKVTKQMYLDFINMYEGDLKLIQTETSDPPMKSYIDKRTNETVATVVMEWMDNNGNIIDDESLFEYYIKDDESPGKGIHIFKVTMDKDFNKTN